MVEGVLRGRNLSVEEIGDSARGMSPDREIEYVVGGIGGGLGVGALSVSAVWILAGRDGKVSDVKAGGIHIHIAGRTVESHRVVMVFEQCNFGLSAVGFLEMIVTILNLRVIAHSR